VKTAFAYSLQIVV